MAQLAASGMLSNLKKSLPALPLAKPLAKPAALSGPDSEGQEGAGNGLVGAMCGCFERVYYVVADLTGQVSIFYLFLNLAFGKL